MGTYKIYTDGGGVIEFTTGNDEFFNVGNGQLIADLNSQDGGLKIPTVTTSMNSMDDIQDGDGTMLSIMEAQNFNKSMIEIDKNNLIKAQNIYLENQQKILKATAQSNIRNTQSLLNSQDANTSTLLSLKKSVDDLAKIIKEKTTTVNASGGTFNLDTSPIVKSLDEMTKNQTLTNSKIIEGVESQKTTNQKIIEKINADLDKNVEFEGKMYNKGELEKLTNLENVKNLKSENDFELNDGLALFEDFTNDGFDIDFNPFDYLLQQVKDGLKDEFQQIKTQYNINIGSI